MTAVFITFLVIVGFALLFSKYFPESEKPYYTRQVNDRLTIIGMITNSQTEDDLNNVQDAINEFRAAYLGTFNYENDLFLITQLMDEKEISIIKRSVKHSKAAPFYPYDSYK